MNNSIPNIAPIEALIRLVAHEEILPRFNKTGYELKTDGSLLTEADLSTDRRIKQGLHELHPSIDFLSEEMTSKEQESLLKNSESLWILDPLDGTSNFAAGIPLFATSLALIQNGRIVLACSYDPIRDEMYSATLGQGAFLNGKPLVCVTSGFTLKHSIAIVDFKRLPKDLTHKLLAKAPYKSQRNLGSCVLEWAWMAANRGHIYLHGGMKLWDYAAGTLLLSEAGGYASTIDGKEIFTPKMQNRSVIISPDKKLYEAWREWLTD